jgi:hypothetical protein
VSSLSGARHCKQQDFYAALQRHIDPDDPHCMPLYAACVIGQDIKPEYQVIHINFANIWFLLNSITWIHAIEKDWVMLLNGNATFGFCHAYIDMIALGFC